MSTRVAVVLFNLGGPDSLDAVRPFLFNLFNDAAIIRLPQPFRWVLAGFLAARRAPFARDIYRHIGGRSPLLERTRAQAAALEAALCDLRDVRVFVAMRYWSPTSTDVAAEIAAYAPDEIVLLPLYPQYSTTTTGSSLVDWDKAMRRAGVDIPTSVVGCYPTVSGLVNAHAQLVLTSLEAVRERCGNDRVRLLLSAHGLPKRIVELGDPYQWQVEQTADAVVRAVGRDDLDWVVCYQSKLGRLEWIGPSTEGEIERAGREGLALVVVPISFVSEHSETLFELDIQYRALAESAGVTSYIRAPALGTQPEFVAALAALVRRARGCKDSVGDAAAAPCPPRFGACVCRSGGGHG